MGMKTNIEWCDSTVNPTTGCDGCELWTPGRGGPCYAGNLHETRLARTLPALYAPTFDEVQLAPGRMVRAVNCPDLTGTMRPDKPWLDGMPRTIFLGDLGDVLSEAVPFEYLESEVVQVANSKKGRQCILMLLTKQAPRLATFARWLTGRGVVWPDNLWVGVSITTSKTLSRVQHLLEVPAAVRYLSVEPMREAIDLTHHDHHGYAWNYLEGEMWSVAHATRKRGLQLVIVGGESSQGAYLANPFDIEWARRIIADCREAGVPCFIKQLGSNVLGLRGQPLDHHGGNWSEWPEDLRVRQMPTAEQALGPTRGLF
jgi:protein gp37